MKQKTYLPTVSTLSTVPTLLAWLVSAFFFSVATHANTENAESAESADHAAWMTDFDAAKAKSKAESKPMFVDFTGSDWCGWCIKLDKEVFSKQAFKDYAGKNLILVEIDFPRKKEQAAELKAQNRALAEKYGVRGFPTILLLNAEGEVIKKTGYRRGGAEKYIEHLKQILASAENNVE